MDERKRILIKCVIKMLQSVLLNNENIQEIRFEHNNDRLKSIQIIF